MTEVVLRESDTSAPPSTSAEAAVRLDTLRADPKWTSALLGGGSEQTKESTICTNSLQKATASTWLWPVFFSRGIIQTSKHMQNIGAAEMLKGLGMPPDVIKETLSGQTAVPKDFYDKIAAWKKNAMSDRTWSNLSDGRRRQSPCPAGNREHYPHRRN